MFAIIETGGKQYKVEPKQIIRVEKIDVAVGAEVVFDQVLLVNQDGNVQVGQPKLANATVKGKVLEHNKGDKVIVFKKRRRKDFRLKNGHRQSWMVVEVTDIKA